MTQVEFAERHGLNVETLRGWIYRDPKGEEVEGRGRFMEVSRSGDAANGAALRVLLGGVTLELRSLPPAEWIRALVSGEGT